MSEIRHRASTRGVERPRGSSPRKALRRRERIQAQKLKSIPGAPPSMRRARSVTSKPELIKIAREMTGRTNMGWKATKKYMQKLDRREKALKALIPKKSRDLVYNSVVEGRTRESRLRRIKRPRWMGGK